MKGTAPRRAEPGGRRGRGGGARRRPQAARRKSDDRRPDAQRSGAGRRDRQRRGARPVRGRDLSDAPPDGQPDHRAAARPASMRSMCWRRSSRAGRSPGRPRSPRSRRCAQLEPEPRGAYTGSMGWIEPGGDAAFNVHDPDAGMAPMASAAPALGSDRGLSSTASHAMNGPSALLKGDFVERETPAFDLIETMRFDPHDGICGARASPRPARHARPTRCDFRFDRHAARNELQAATFGRKERAMVRLLLSPTGTMAIQVKHYDEPTETPVRRRGAPVAGRIRATSACATRPPTAASTTARGRRTGPMRRSSSMARAS